MNTIFSRQIDKKRENTIVVVFGNRFSLDTISLSDKRSICMSWPNRGEFTCQWVLSFGAHGGDLIKRAFESASDYLIFFVFILVYVQMFLLNEFGDIFSPALWSKEELCVGVSQTVDTCTRTHAFDFAGLFFYCCCLRFFKFFFRLRFWEESYLVNLPRTSASRVLFT